MTKKTYHGSCHCGRVTFEADIDLSKGTGKCNCTSCWKRRAWNVQVPAADFRAGKGEDLLSAAHRDKATTGSFCTHCGTTPYGRIAAAEWNDGEAVSINVACLDDLDIDDLMAAPITHFDGLHNNWWHTPEETRHL